jgi:hypothetical protein
MRGAGSDIPRKDGANLSHHTATLQLLCSNEPSRAARRASARAHKMNTIPQRRRDLARPHAMSRPQTTADTRQRYERYLTRARKAQIAGDAIEMENCYQHAEHYLRVMRGEGHERRGHL